MAHHQSHGHHQQTQQRCTICVLFQGMGSGQYRSSSDREMYLHHLQTAHGVNLSEGRAGDGPDKGDVLRR